MKNKIFVLFILAAFLFSALGPVPSIAYAAETTGTLTLVIDNKTGQTFTMTLTGPASYRWTVRPGKSNHEVLPGKYKYTYKACGGDKTGNVLVKVDNKTLNLAACKQKASGGMANVKIYNNTGGYIVINLTGPATYRFSFGPGTSTMTIIRGKYSYTVYGCGGASLSGTKNFTSRTSWRFWCY